MLQVEDGSGWLPIILSTLRLFRRGAPRNSGEGCNRSEASHVFDVRRVREHSVARASACAYHETVS